MKKIAIIGAGVVGATTAYALSRSGAQVTLFDREDEPAQKCSYANGGQVSVCNAETWNTWKNVYKGLKWMTQKDAPLLIRPNMTPAKIAWLAGFLWHTVNGTQRKNTIETIQLGTRSSEIYDLIVEREGLQFDQAKSGMLHVYSSHAEWAAAAESAALFEDHGVEWRSVDRDEIIKIDPNMSAYRDLVGGYLTSSDWVGDARKFSAEIIKCAVQKYGLEVRMGTEVVSVDGSKVEYTQPLFGFKTHQRFDATVICAGQEIMQWSRRFRDGLNVYPVKGYSITVESAPAAPRVSLLDDSKKIVCSNLGGRFRVAGTAELDRDPGPGDVPIRSDRIEPLIRWVEHNFPEVDVRNKDNRMDWACLRPMNSNMMPIVQRSRQNGIFYHGGHGHLGWTLAAGTTERLLQLLGYKMDL